MTASMGDTDMLSQNMILWVSERVEEARRILRDDRSTESQRNVAPPKPEPVLREAWINLGPDGWQSRTPTSREEADKIAHETRVECRRIAWMSDGSPVPGEDDYVGMMGKIAMLEQQRDSLKAEIARMRPVVRAAAAFIPPSAGHAEFVALREAIRAYQSSPKKTAEEAAALQHHAPPKTRTVSESLLRDISDYLENCANTFCDLGRPLQMNHAAMLLKLVQRELEG
jgi:hypothetical protein